MGEDAQVDDVEENADFGSNEGPGELHRPEDGPEKREKTH
jgi:hypothetical protein